MLWLDLNDAASGNTSDCLANISFRSVIVETNAIAVVNDSQFAP